MVVNPINQLTITLEDFPSEVKCAILENLSIPDLFDSCGTTRSLTDLAQYTIGYLQRPPGMSYKAYIQQLQDTVDKIQKDPTAKYKTSDLPPPLSLNSPFRDILSVGKYIEARNLLIEWDILAKEIQVLSPEIGSESTMDQIIEKAKGLSDWRTEHKDTLAKVEHLNLSERHFSAIPDIFGNLPNLQRLNLEFIPLIPLPASLRNLPYLRILRCSVGQVSSLANHLKDLKDLTIIFIDNGRMYGGNPKDLIDYPNISE